MAKKNAFLMQMQAKADKKASARAEMHVEVDTMAMLLAIHDTLEVGKGRSPMVLNSFLAYKIEIAEEILKEISEDQSKKKEIILVRRDLAARMKEILGKDGWEQYKTLFPFLRDYWEW